jgi:hypothetical protein
LLRGELPELLEPKNERAGNRAEEELSPVEGRGIEEVAQPVDAHDGELGESDASHREPQPSVREEAGLERRHVFGARDPTIAIGTGIMRTG